MGCQVPEAEDIRLTAPFEHNGFHVRDFRSSVIGPGRIQAADGSFISVRMSRTAQIVTFPGEPLSVERPFEEMDFDEGARTLARMAFALTNQYPSEEQITASE